MADVEDLKIVFRAEVDKAIKDLKKVSRAGKETDQTWTGKANDFVKTTKKSLDLKNAFSQLSLQVAGGIGIYSLASAAVHGLGKVIGDSVQNWAELERAQLALGAAAGASAAGLDDYASSMARATGQTTTQILAYEAMLASAGRSEAQIRQIISAAADFSAGSGKSMDEIIRQLNKSFGGLSGELGESIPEIKSLTSEQLKAGGAVDFIAQKYKGLNAVLSQSTDVSLKNFTNAWKDLEAEIGKAMSHDLKSWIQGATGAMDSVRKQLSATQAYSEYKKSGASKMSDTDLSTALAFAKAQVQLTEETVKFKQVREQFEKEYNQAIDLITREIANRKTAETTTSKGSIDTGRNDAAASHIASVDAALKARIAAMELEAEVTGKQVSAQDELNAYVDAYVKLITESNGLVTANNSAAKAYASTISNLAGEVDAEAQAEKDKKKAEDEAKKTLERLASLYQDTPEGVKAAKEETLAFVQAQKANAAATDASAEELARFDAIMRSLSGENEKAQAALQRIDSLYASTPEGAKAAAEETLAFVQAQRSNALATGASSEELGKLDAIIADLTTGKAGAASFEDWVDGNTAKLLELIGVSKELSSVFGDLNAQLASLAVEGTVDGFKKLGEAFSDGKLSGEDLQETLAAVSKTILDELPMLFVQAGLSLIAQNPSMWAVGLGLIAAGLSSAFIDGLVNQETSSDTTTANAKGNAYDDGNLIRFATGGAFTNRVVRRATNFNMGQMGEKGPEAIVPLERMENGALGIHAAGMGAPQTVVNVQNYSGQEVSTTSSDDGMAKTIEVMVGSLVDKNLASGRHDKALMGRYTVRKQATRG